MEVCDIVQEAVTKPSPKKCKKAKWSSEEARQIAENRRKAKSKGERDRYTQLNTKFQRTVRRYKKAFLNDQYKEIQENNRMGKSRDLFKRIRNTKGTFHAKTGTIKDRNSMNLTEAEDFKKRWQEYTEVYRKDLHEPSWCDHSPRARHLEVQSQVGLMKHHYEYTITASEGDGIIADLFQILKDDAVKVMHSICKQIWKTQQWPQE